MEFPTRRTVVFGDPYFKFASAVYVSCSLSSEYVPFINPKVIPYIISYITPL